MVAGTCKCSFNCVYRGMRACSYMPFESILAAIAGIYMSTRLTPRTQRVSTAPESLMPPPQNLAGFTMSSPGKNKLFLSINTDSNNITVVLYLAEICFVDTSQYQYNDAALPLLS